MTLGPLRLFASHSCLIAPDKLSCLRVTRGEYCASKLESVCRCMLGLARCGAVSCVGSRLRLYINRLTYQATIYDTHIL